MAGRMVKVFTLRTLEGAQDLAPGLARDTRPVIVEAGFIDPEGAATDRGLVVEGTVVRSGARSMRRWQLPWPRYLELAGVELVCDATIVPYYAATTWTVGSPRCGSYPAAAAVLMAIGAQHGLARRLRPRGASR
jgi:hypothetical protein